MPPKHEQPPRTGKSPKQQLYDEHPELFKEVTFGEKSEQPRPYKIKFHLDDNSTVTVATSELSPATIQDLLKDLRSAKTNKVTTVEMEFDTQQIIEQARTEAPPAPRTPEHSEPETRSELATIAIEAANLGSALDKLREEDLPLTATEARLAIAGLRNIATHSETTAWRLGLHAIEQRLITQAELAELLEVSPKTVSRRYLESPNPDEPEKHQA